jgi:hypothetical protein
MVGRFVRNGAPLGVLKESEQSEQSERPMRVDPRELNKYRIK